MKSVKRRRAKKTLDQKSPLNVDSNEFKDYLAVTKAYNYFNQVDIKTARKWIDQYILKNNLQINSFSKVKDDHIPMWLCVNCHLLNHDKLLPEDLIEKTQSRLHELTVNITPREKKKLQSSNLEMSSKTIAYVEDILDQFYKNSYSIDDWSLYDDFKKQEIKQSDARRVVEYYTPLVSELENIEICPQLKEAYAKLTKKQKKSYVDFVNTIVADAKVYTETERKVRKTRAPRKKKLKTADQLTSNVVFLPEDTELQIASVPPQNIVGANAVWLYNTKYRRLVLLQADKDQTLTVKGTTVIGFNETLSVAKTLRKPKEQLSALASLGRVTMKKEFEKIRAKNQTVTGRIGKDTIILRVV